MQFKAVAAFTRANMSGSIAHSTLSSSNSTSLHVCGWQPKQMGRCKSAGKLSGRHKRPTLPCYSNCCKHVQVQAGQQACCR
eukprot:3738257-Amphidinium_carterae.1